ncbi:hypothetical protein D3C76_1471520 [compost metagenome]
MSHAQVLIQAALQPRTVHRLLGDGALGQLAAYHFAEQVVLGREVVVESATGQADGLHQPGHTRGSEAAAFGQGAAALQQLLPGLFLVLGGIAHAGNLRRAGLTKPES